MEPTKTTMKETMQEKISDITITCEPISAQLSIEEARIVSGSPIIENEPQN